MAAGRVIAQAFLSAVLTRRPALPEALVPVPLHWLRLQHRGFNQAIEVARPLAETLNLPILLNALRRPRRTAFQRGQSARARRKNLRNALAPGGAQLPEHVALVDDVMTTGSTLAACARVLHAAGASRIDVWVVARVLPPDYFSK